MSNVEYSCCDCCGLQELVGICDVRVTPKDIVSYVKNSAFPGSEYETIIRPAVIVLTDIKPMVLSFGDEHLWDTAPYARGAALTRYIKKYKLGTIVSAPPRKNLNSGNFVRGYLWSPNWYNIGKHIP